MFSEFWHTRVGVWKICVFNCACYTSIFTIFKGQKNSYISYIVLSSGVSEVPGTCMCFPGREY